MSIAVKTTSFQVEKRSWLIPQPGGIGYGYTEDGTLDVSAFTAATHYPNGYFLSGIWVAEITASGLLGPYDDSKSNGQEVAAGILFSSVEVPNLLDLTVDAPCAVLSAFAVVSLSKLPISSGATGRGYADANGQADLPLIKFVA